jgi:ribokinase
LFPLLDVIRPNAAEAEALTGIVVRDRASAQRAAERLLGRGVGAVAVQAGDEGNLLVWREGRCWLPKVPVASVDATGAGDAFAAGLAVMLAEGRPLEEAGPFANAAAALATTVVGAQAGLPRRAAVQELLASAGGRPMV